MKLEKPHLDSSFWPENPRTRLFLNHPNLPLFKLDDTINPCKISENLLMRKNESKNGQTEKRSDGRYFIGPSLRRSNNVMSRIKYCEKTIEICFNVSKLITYGTWFQKRGMRMGSHYP